MCRNGDPDGNSLSFSSESKSGSRRRQLLQTLVSRPKRWVFGDHHPPGRTSKKSEAARLNQFLQAGIREGLWVIIYIEIRWSAWVHPPFKYTPTMYDHRIIGIMMIHKWMGSNKPIWTVIWTSRKLQNLSRSRPCVDSTIRPVLVDLNAWCHSIVTIRHRNYRWMVRLLLMMMMMRMRRRRTPTTILIHTHILYAYPAHTLLLLLRLLRLLRLLLLLPLLLLLLGGCGCGRGRGPQYVSTISCLLGVADDHIRRWVDVLPWCLFPQPILYHPRPLRTVLGPCKQIQFWMGESSFPLFNWWFFSFFYLSIFIFFWIIQIAFCFRWNHFSWLIPVCRVLPVNSSRLVDIFLRKDHRFGCFISPCLGPHLCSPLPRTTGAAVAMATTATPSTFVSTATRAATRPRPRRPAWRRRWPCWPGGGGKPQPAGPQTWKVGWGVGRFNGINGG